MTYFIWINHSARSLKARYFNISKQDDLFLLKRSKVRKKYTSSPRYWNVPVLVNTGTFLVYQHCLKICYLRSLKSAGVIQKFAILERKNGLVLSNTRVLVSGTWSILFPKVQKGMSISETNTIPKIMSFRACQILWNGYILSFHAWKDATNLKMFVGIARWRISKWFD